MSSAAKPATAVLLTPFLHLKGLFLSTHSAVCLCRVLPRLGGKTDAYFVRPTETQSTRRRR